MNGGEKAVETIRIVSAWLAEGHDPATFEPVRAQIEQTDAHDIAMVAGAIINYLEVRGLEALLEVSVMVANRDDLPS